MARHLSFGTPSRALRYLMPGDRSPLLRLSMAAGGLVLVIAAVVFLAGVKRLASPGPVAAAHAAAETQCAQCHAPVKGAADLRCERCHDPIDSQRLSGAAHVTLARGGSWLAPPTPAVTCVACHTEHRGRDQPLRAVADARCATCHTFASFRKHPEFAAVRAASSPAAGLDFSHEKHLGEVAKTGGDRCQTCHQPTADQKAFEPIAFDTHCARCHVKNRALTLNGIDVLPSLFVPADVLLPGKPAAPGAGLSEPDGRNRVMVLQMGHRDAWVLANASRLSQAASGEAVAAERERLVARIARLSSIVAARPVDALPDAELTALSASLRTDGARLDAPGADGTDLSRLRALVAAIDPAAAQLTPPAGPAKSEPTAARAADASQVEPLRAQLQQLLDAITARQGSAVDPRVGALRKRLADLKPDTSTPAADTAGLLARLDEVRAGMAIAGQQASASEIARAERVSDALRQQIAGGLDPAASEARRRELLALVDALAARATPALAARAAELRAAVVSLDTASVRRDSRQRFLDRVELEAMLRPGGRAIGADMITGRERADAARRLQTARARLAAVGLAAAPVDAARAKSALQGLLNACLKCHQLDQDGTAMRPMGGAAAILTDATFSHKPHTVQQRCESCHTTVAASRAGMDVNLPDVASCRACHDGSRARATCAECHGYHPRSAAHLVEARWR